MENSLNKPTEKYYTLIDFVEDHSDEELHRITNCFGKASYSASFEYLERLKDASVAFDEIGFDLIKKSWPDYVDKVTNRNLHIEDSLRQMFVWLFVQEWLHCRMDARNGMFN